MWIFHRSLPAHSGDLNADYFYIVQVLPANSLKHQALFFLVWTLSLKSGPHATRSIVDCVVQPPPRFSGEHTVMQTIKMGNRYIHDGFPFLGSQSSSWMIMHPLIGTNYMPVVKGKYPMSSILYIHRLYTSLEMKRLQRECLMQWRFSDASASGSQ